MSQPKNVEIQYLLTVNTEHAQRDIRRLETSLMRIMNAIERLTPNNTELSKLITIAQNTITIMVALQNTIRATQLALGPIGWLYAGTSMLATGLTGYSLYESMRGI
jgi:hypothetical protein